MGLLADFYVSTEADALAYDKSQSVSDPEDLAQYKSLTEIPLSTLWAMLQGIEWSLEMIDEFEEIFSRDDWEVLSSDCQQNSLPDCQNSTRGRWMKSSQRGLKRRS